MLNSLFNDKAITSESEDSLFIKHRAVDKITALLSKKELSSLTVAITGEWGGRENILYESP